MSDVKKVITAADRSTKALISATTGLQKVTTELVGLSELTVNLSQEIEFKQSDLDNLSAQFETRFREASAELKLKVVEDEEKVLATLLKARGFITITQNELSDLQKKLQYAERDTAEELTAATAEGKRVAAIEYNAQKSKIESDHLVAIAQLEANAKSAEERIAFLTEQNADLKNQISEEREVRVKVAQAEASRQAVTVNNGK